MVAKSELKFIKSLQQKKYRMQHGLFVAEGVKMIQDLLNAGQELYALYATEAGLFHAADKKFSLVSETDLKRMSSLKNPNKGLAVFHIQKEKALAYTGWTIVLDGVQDPGNLGTIIRLCDWFGAARLVCSPQTVDCYNPKVLQATMGSIARVPIIYTHLNEYLSKATCPVYGSYMGAAAVSESTLPEEGILVMGNEAHGISDETSRYLSHRISIPAHDKNGAESLNVATATAILLYELRRS